MVPYVDVVVTVAVMRVLLCVFHVCLLRECEGARVTTMLVWVIGEMLLCRTCGWYTWFMYYV